MILVIQTYVQSKYINRDDDILMIKLLGQGTLLTKTDSKSDFVCYLLINPGDFDLTEAKSYTFLGWLYLRGSNIFHF